MKNTSKVTLTLIAFFLTATYHVTSAQPNYPTNPEKAKLIYSDVENFVKAFENLRNTKDTIAVLNQYYFDHGSDGLKEYINKHNLTPKMLKDAIAKNPDRYSKIAGFLANESSFKPEFTKTMQAFHDVVPSAMYPPTYLLVGANRGIGQASKFGQLITITRVVDNNEKLKKLIVHELAHFQQAITMGIQEYVSLYGKPNNMLGLCLREGGAEFVTHLVLQEITQANGLEYLQNNESDLKSRFLRDLSLQDTGFWLWESIEDPDTPTLLGYVMGYKICDAYYQRESDKENALKAILAITDPEAFLEMSPYFRE